VSLICRQSCCAQCGRDVQGRLDDDGKFQFRCRCGCCWSEGSRDVLLASMDLHNRAYAEAHGWKKTAASHEQAARRTSP
jgi:hypothetical protein